MRNVRTASKVELAAWFVRAASTYGQSLPLEGTDVADRILIADDEPDIRSVLSLYMENAGYEVVEAADGGEALDVLQHQHIDLCLLDIMMPVLDGYHVLKRIRETSDIPVIVISAKGQDPEKILGLNLGADDYMVKPFNPLEAVARVGSILRRMKGMVAQQPPSTVLRCRDLTLDVDACLLTHQGEPVELTPVELRIMKLLMENPGRVFTKQQLYEHGWEEEYLAAENSVMVCISKLRSKLSDDPQAYIKTIRGIGYRLEK